MSSIGAIGGSNYVTAQPVRRAERPDIAQTAKKLFSALDTTGQGFIQKADLQNAFKQSSSTANPASSSSDSVDDLFSALDTDNNGKVTQQEFTDSLQRLAGRDAQPSPGMAPPGGGMGGPGGTPPPGGGMGGPGGAPPPGGGMLGAQAPSGAASSKTSGLTTSFDPADTNQDGTVSLQEALAYAQSNANANSASSTDGQSANASNRPELTRQIAQLAQAYGMGGGGQERAQPSLSVTA